MCYNAFVSRNQDYLLKNRERWLELAELAAKEQNPDKMMALISEINQLLAEKQERLDALRPPKPSE
jgi:hypothetical protein